MIRTFDDIYRTVERLPKRTLSVAMAEDSNLLEAIKIVEEIGIAKALLVGNPEKIRETSREIDFSVKNDKIVPAESPEEAAAIAVELIQLQKADILMKGHISTSVLMKAVFNKEKGLRTGNVLSHVAVAEVPTYPRLILLSDGGINITPDLESKKLILFNLIAVANSLGIESPHIAALCPIEKVNPKIQETIDAAELQEMTEKGEFGNIILEGPIAMDVALSAKAAELKGIKSRIAGKTDAFLVPNITSGNAVIKVLMFLANAKVGGLVIGAKVPIILLSRSDKSEDKLNSIALSILVSDYHNRAN